MTQLTGSNSHELMNLRKMNRWNDDKSMNWKYPSPQIRWSREIPDSSYLRHVDRTRYREGRYTILRRWSSALDSVNRLQNRWFEHTRITENGERRSHSTSNFNGGTKLSTKKFIQNSTTLQMIYSPLFIGVTTHARRPIMSRPTTYRTTTSDLWK